MKRKKLFAVVLAGVLAMTLFTACAPLDALYDWFFGGGSSASRGNGLNVVESTTLEEQIERYFGVSNTVKSDRCKDALEEVAAQFEESWLTDNQLNDTAQTALDSIADTAMKRDFLITYMDVMEVTPPAKTFDTSDTRELYKNEYGFGSNSSSIDYESKLVTYPAAKTRMEWMRDTSYGVELYAGVFTKNGKTYAAMILIYTHNENPKG